MHKHQFDASKLERLNNPERLKKIPIEHLLKIANLDSVETIIDFGAGSGFFSKEIAKHFETATIYACDISPVMVAYMKECVQSENPNIIPTLINDSELNFTENSVDFIYMINVHHELDRVLETLKICYHVLKPGGKIAISDWKKEPMLSGPNIVIRAAIETVEKQLESSGFSSIVNDNSLEENYIVVGKK